MEYRHVFIVGCDRSGTTLLVRTLNKHRDIYITNQTHFMGHLLRPGLRQKIRELGDPSNDDDVPKIVEAMHSGTLSMPGAYWRWVSANVDQEVLVQRILDSDRSERALFSIVMQLQAKGETVLGEKTPDHFKYVPTLLEWFPHAKIVQMIRDPRAIYVSELKRYQGQTKPTSAFPYKQLRPIKPLFAFYILLHMTFDWLFVAKLHFRYERQYPENYCLLRFEDLISEPENQVRRLCDFIGVDFQAEMLEQKVINTSFPSRKAMPGFDKQAISRWKDYVGPGVKGWFSLLARGYLEKLGYTN